VEYLHGKRLIHRDLALRNILVRMINGSPEIKIADFGLTRVMDDQVTATTGTSTDLCV
jgi:serine/threonine protein kinase